MVKKVGSASEKLTYHEGFIAASSCNEKTKKTSKEIAFRLDVNSQQHRAIMIFNKKHCLMVKNQRQAVKRKPLV